MSAPGIPQNFIAQSANQQILLSWDLSAGADSYQLFRSEDNVTYTLLATINGSPLATSYIDTTAILAVQYWYKVSALTGLDASPLTSVQSAVAVPTGEKCLSQIRLNSMQKADRVNSNFVTKSEWNTYINLAMFELYDLLVTTYEDLYVAPAIQFVCDGVTYQYPLPNGSNTFLDANNPAVSFIPKPFYKLLGVDLALQNVNNAYVTVNKFNFIDRNRFVYPNTSSTLYGVFNLQYRLLGNNSIMFIPTPSGGQAIRIWYIPRLTELLQDTDTTDTSVSGWIQYVICRAAKYALDKEESDTTKIDQEILYLKARIEDTSMNHDAGQADTISDVRNGYGSPNGGWNRSSGGF